MVVPALVGYIDVAWWGGGGGQETDLLQKRVYTLVFVGGGYWCGRGRWWVWFRVVVVVVVGMKTISSLENEPKQLVFEGGGWRQVVMVVGSGGGHGGPHGQRRTVPCQIMVVEEKKNNLWTHLCVRCPWWCRCQNNHLLQKQVGTLVFVGGRPQLWCCGMVVIAGGGSGAGRRHRGWYWWPCQLTTLWALYLAPHIPGGILEESQSSW